MPSRNSTATGIRIDNVSIARIKAKCLKKGWSFNQWVNYAVAQGLRSHKKKEV